MNVLSASVFAIEGAGKSALLHALPESLRLPEGNCLCLLDASRLEDPAQKDLIPRLAAHCRETGQEPIFVLTRADSLPYLRSSMPRIRTMLRDAGFDGAEIYPVCAEAAGLFLLPTQGRELSAAEQSALAAAYDRFGPAENSLAGYAVTDGMSCYAESREISPVQLRLALENTGIPTLIARLEEPVRKRAKPAVAAAIVPETPHSAEPVPEAPAAKPSAPETGTGLYTAPEDLPTQPAEPEPALTEVTAEATDAEPEAEPAPAGVYGTVDPEAWFARIREATAEELPELDASIRVLPVDETASAELRAALARRRWDLMCERMDRMVRGYEELDCAGLLQLAQQVRNSDYPDAIKKKTLDVLHTQFQSRELTELRELTLDTDHLDIPGLYALIDRINAGPYTAQSRIPYTDLLNHRIDELHVQDMEDICIDLEAAEQEDLDRIRAEIDGQDCAEVLKTEFYRRLEKRQDMLDYGKLERLTADAELKSVKELTVIAEELEEDGWNPKFVNSFRHRINLCLDAARYHDLQEQTQELDSMSRKDVEALKERISEQQLPDRIQSEALRRMDERIYRLDMLKLLTMQNDFDSLGFDEIDGLRTRLSREEVCERSRKEYLARLEQREHALIYENTISHATLVQQTITQFKLRLVDFDISTTDPKYDDKLRQFWGGTGLEQPRDIPVFLHANVSTLGFSGTRFWYKSGRDLAFMPLEEIESFQCLKQMLSANLQIVRKDGTYLLTDAKLFRNNANQVLDFLNECLRRWKEVSLPSGSSMAAYHTPGFDAEALAAAIPTRPLSEDSVLKILQKRYAAEKLKAGSLIGDDAEAWQAKTKKLIQNFELPEKTKLVWFDGTGLLGSVKEGIAFGPQGIYLREAKQSTVFIPTEEIYGITRGGKRVALMRLDNQSQGLDLAPAMAPLLDDYVRGIQLIRKLSE